jgi:hypothetical protein|eukprot:2586793-Prymnesium_polylepis.1
MVIGPSFVPVDILLHCHISTVSRSTSVLPSLAFIKTHKTGGSTVSGILNRIADARNLTKLCPSDDIHLGWPGPFPGHLRPDGNHVYDVINNHAILNRAHMETFLRRPGFFLTVLREPVSQAVSAFNWFGYASHRSWREQLEWLRRLKTNHGSDAARLDNSMASDLGWYGTRERATSFRDITSFVGQLGNDLDYVFLLEKLDEGLVLLAHMLGLSLPEVAYASMKMNHTPYIQPTEQEVLQLKSSLQPDMTVYSFFKERWLTLWANQTLQHPELLQQVSNLKCINKELANRTLSKFSMDSLGYTRYLCSRERLARLDDNRGM